MENIELTISERKLKRVLKDLKLPIEKNFIYNKETFIKWFIENFHNRIQKRANIRKKLSEK